MGLTHPLVGHQSWRQTDTWAVAQRMAEAGPLQPHVYWGGGGPVAMEAPIYSLLLAVLGGSPMMGRLLSLVLSLLAVAVLHDLVRRTSGLVAAHWAAGLFALLPIGAFYGRAVQPEALLMLASVGSVWAFRRWLDSEWAGDAVLTAAAVAVTGLTKPYGLLVGLPMAWMLVHERGWRTLARPVPLAIAGVSLGLTAAWFAHAAGIAAESGLAFFSAEPGVDKWGHIGLLADPVFWEKLLLRRIGQHLLGLGAVPLVLYGLWTRETDDERVYGWWLLGGVAYVLVVARGNDVHDYYQLPLLAPLCALAGLGARRLLCDRTGSAVLAICLLATVVQGVGTWSKLMAKERPDDPRLAAAAACRETVPADARIVATGPNHDPTLLNLCQRSGWVLAPDEVTHALLTDLQARGATWLVTTERVRVEGEVVWSEAGTLVRLR